MATLAVVAAAAGEDIGGWHGEVGDDARSGAKSIELSGVCS
jgi:hypothetical protein